MSPPPPPAVEIGSFRNPSDKVSSFFPESDQPTMNPSPYSFGFGVGSGGYNTKSRSKPRLVKLKKNGRKVRGGNSFSGEIQSGFNPFAPPPPSKGMNSGNDDCESSPVDKCFVFGANENVSGSGYAPVTPVSDEEEFSTPIGDSVFTPKPAKERSGNVDDDHKLDNIRMHSESTSCGDGENRVRFDGGRGNGSGEGVKNQDASESTSCSDTCGVFNGCEVNLPADMKKLNISDTSVDSRNSNHEEARKSNNGPAFIFGSFRKVDTVFKSTATTSESSSFGSNGLHQSHNATFHSETTNVNNFTTTSFDGFKAPQWDPSLLKNILFPEVSRNPVHVRRNRSSKDKRSKKVKEKTKKHEANRCKDKASEGIESQEKLSSPGYGSPMDFSPYEGEKASDQFPTETPVTSVDPSHLRDHGSSSMPNFSFTASTSQGKIPNKKLQAVKKYRRKLNNGFPRNNLTATLRNNQENQPVNTAETKHESSSTSTMPNVCEVWRLRGNQAYKNGDMCKAEECYTHGINSSLPSDNSEYSVKPLALCYGNRAATRISLGRLREAISDCEMAASLDPSYDKVYMRAANCHLVLGELGSAVQYFNKCMESASSVCLDRRTTIESAEGLQQAQRVAEYTNSASVFLEKRTPDGASDALVPITNALSISSCSDHLLQMKAEALFMIRHYKEVIELCESTLQTAEKNLVSAGLDGTKVVEGLGSTHQSHIVWRWNLISKSHFYLGNLEMALDILEKLQQVESSRNENQEECRDSASLMATISELLRYKNAGNEAVRAGKYMEAVEQYTAALSRNVDSRPFAAICFCNRAAANQALLQIADAIADCSLAMALDENYTKAVSRRATLHEMIRDYNQAASDLQRLIVILVKQSNAPEASADRASSRKELRQARQRLSLMEEKAKETIPLDFFLIMGVKASDSAADIKKAYRKAALRHHPDKAAQILVRSESEGPWLKEILEEVHKGADRLFKMIGEAYSVLSDPTKRSDYELEEEIRKARAYRESCRSKGNRKAAEASSPPYHTSPNRRYWRESGRTYRNSASWWYNT